MFYFRNSVLGLVLLSLSSFAYAIADNAFLKENENKAGVKTLPSGLQFKVIKSGEGTSPGPTDLVTVHYRGTLTDGQEFDSSYSRGEPATFGVNAVIPGWTEAIQLMKPGAKWMLYIPPELAYGTQGVGPIKPNSTLIFEVELLSFQSADLDNSLINLEEE